MALSIIPVKDGLHVDSSTPIPAASQSNDHEISSEYANITRKKSVTFSVLDIREYEVTLGDHPGLFSNGPSLSLGWSYNNYRNINVDFYEAQRAITGRRKRDEMIMPRFERENLLRDFGYSRRDIEKSVQDRASFLKQKSKSMKKWDSITLPLRNRRQSLKRFLRPSAA